MRILSNLVTRGPSGASDESSVASGGGSEASEGGRGRLWMGMVRGRLGIFRGRLGVFFGGDVWVGSETSGAAWEVSEDG